MRTISLAALVPVALAALSPANAAAGLPHQWSRSYGDTDYQFFLYPESSTAGDVILAGALQGAADLGGGLLTSAGAEDFLLARLDADGNHVWSFVRGDSADQLITSVVVDRSPDASDEIVVAGIFHGTLALGSVPLVSTGPLRSDVFVAKFDIGGNHVWSLQSISPDPEQVWDVALDGAGNVCVTGTFDGNLDLGAGPIPAVGSESAFLAKLDPDGNLLWTRTYGETVARGTEVAIDPSGNVFFTGTFRDSVDFGGGMLTAQGLEDTFVVKLDALGNHVWSARYGTSVATPTALELIDHDPVLGGSFSGSIDFGNGPLVTPGVSLFVARLGARGAASWSHAYGDSTPGGGVFLDVDASGNVLLHGHFHGEIDFGGGPLVAPSGCINTADCLDLFLAALDSNGQHLWSASFGDSANGQKAMGVAVDVSGNVLATGLFHGSVDFGGGSLTSNGLSDYYVAKFGPTGPTAAEDLGAIRAAIAYPTPFRESVTIRCSVAGGDPSLARVYDVRGRLVRVLSGTRDGPGARIVWDGRNDRGRPVPAGLYLIRSGEGSRAALAKVVRLR